MNWHMSSEMRTPECVPIPSMKQTGLNRRQSTRVHCRIEVNLQTADGRDISATCLDINSGGIGIESARVLTVGQRLNLLVPSTRGAGSQGMVPMLVVYRMENHYGLSALGAYEDLLNLIPTQA